MPSQMRSTGSRAEVKYNVTTDFPDLSLHYAASTGDVGLAKYALSHGQPVNSVLGGVLPLHAACAGGSEAVVQLLIEHGADVNAPRLPRKYSADKGRDSSAPIVGESGATPLHFACANGHADIVSLLLLKGAHADRADKHGTTPQMIAKQEGWLECEKVLRNWLLNKDRDLRERQFSISNNSTYSLGDLPPRVRVKRSVENTFNMLRGSNGNLSEAYHRASPSLATTPLATSTPPPASPASPPPQATKFGEYTFYPVSPSDDGRSMPVDLYARRPSLPHLDVGGVGQTDSIGEGAKLSKRKLHRRPRSAGHDAEPSSPSSRLAPPKRLATKHSFMNMFNNTLNNKRQHDLATAPPTPSTSTPSTQRSSPSVGTLAGSTVQSPTPPQQPSYSNPGKQRHRMGSDTARQQGASHQMISSSSISPPPREDSAHHPPRPLAVDVHNALAQYRLGAPTRDRSISAGSGTTFDIPPSTTKPVPIPIPKTSPTHNADSFMSTGGVARSFESGSPGSWAGSIGSPGSHKSLSTSSSPIARLTALKEQDRAPKKQSERSGSHRRNSSRTASREEDPIAILRAHAVESGYANSALRALKLDTTSATVGSSSTASGSGSRRGLRSSTSASSLGRGGVSPVEPQNQPRLPDSTPSNDFEFDRHPVIFLEEDDEEDDEYLCGPPPHPHPYHPSKDDAKMRANARVGIRPIATIVNRERGSSFASSDSLSPILTHEPGAAKGIHSDFPFSLSPPSMPPPQESYTLLRARGSSRSRGDSLSSMGTASTTDDSQVLSSSALTSTSGGASATMTAPSLAALPEQLPAPERLVLKDGEIEIVVKSDTGESSQIAVADTRGSPPAPQPVGVVGSQPSLNGAGSFRDRRSRTPNHLDLSGESSPMDPDDLVHKAQQQILADATDGNALPPVPLSAKLAAYGEALEKKHQQQPTNLSQSNLAQGSQPNSSASIREPSPSPNSATRFRQASSTPSTTGGVGGSVASGGSGGGGVGRPPVPQRSPHRGDIVNRQLSMESAVRIRVRSRVPRRPHTSQGDDGTQTSRLFAPLDGRSTVRGHHPRSASAAHSAAIDLLDSDSSPLSAIPSEGHSPVVIHRSPASSNLPLDSKVTLEEEEPDTPLDADRSSGEDVDSDLDLGINGGAPLARTTTSPHLSASISKREQARTIASAHKLTRMGFSPAEFSSTYRTTPIGLSQTSLTPQPQAKLGFLKSWFKGSSK